MYENLPDCFVDPESSRVTKYKYTSEPNTNTISTNFTKLLTIGIVQAHVISCEVFLLVLDIFRAAASIQKGRKGEGGESQCWIRFVKANVPDLFRVIPIIPLRHPQSSTPLMSVLVCGGYHVQHIRS